MDTVTSTYHLPLVLLSILIAVAASFTALDISIRIKKSKKRAQYSWIFTGAFVMGMGIWTMHFISMLAFHLSIPVTYNITLVIVSIVPAVISSGIAFTIISRQTLGLKQVIWGAFFIAAGIVSMHFIGMEAMEMEAMIEYDPVLVIASAIIAFIASSAALYLLFFVSKTPDTPRNWWKKAGSALIMGFAITGMHYTGMSAAVYHPHHNTGLTGTAFDSTSLAYFLGIGMLILFGLVFISIFIDKRFETQTIKSERKFRSVIESANDAIILADSKGTIVSWNKGAELILGYNEKEVIGRNIQLIIPKKFREAHKKGMQRYVTTRVPHVIGKTVELQGLRKDGKEFPIELSIATWTEEGQIYFSSIIRDITERKQAEKKITQMVYRDPLTGLPNRRLLNDRLKQALGQAHENQQTLGVMFIDLDRFKYINDTLGHAIGDQLLIEVARRLNSCTGEADTVSRQGGDEFIILLPQTTSDKVSKTAQNMIDSFSQSIDLEDHELFITPSIGIALYPYDGRDFETLIKNADTAMYRVKEQGRNSFQFYTPDMNESVSRRLKLEIGLRKALEQNEFKVVYQPQIEVSTGKIIGVEALARWYHDDWGDISPMEFIPLAEETGLILPLGEWVLHEACLQNKKWQDEGYPPLRMAVNISSIQFQQSNIVEIIRTILLDTGLDPSYLELELTESIIQNSKHAISKMHQLKEMGIHLSIDDFGTGYSSLSYLKTFPINTLKIDQTFTRNIFTDPKDASLVSTIISMAHNLELKVIAEGVETIEQLHFLQQRNCNEAQGYYFSKPISTEEMPMIFNSQFTSQVN